MLFSITSFTVLAISGTPLHFKASKEKFIKLSKLREVPRNELHTQRLKSHAQKLTTESNKILCLKCFALDSKLLFYKTALKPIWTYGIPLYGTASNSNIEILQRFKNKVLRVLVNAPRYVPNWLIHRDLNVPTVREVITRVCAHYCGRLQIHPSHLQNILTEDEEETRRLKRFKPPDLRTRFTYTTLIPCYCPVLTLVIAQLKVPTSVSCFLSIDSIRWNISLHALIVSSPGHIHTMDLLPSFG